MRFDSDGRCSDRELDSRVTLFAYPMCPKTIATSIILQRRDIRLLLAAP